MAKRLLMTPGPTPVPPEVFAAMSQPMTHHRTRGFREHARAPPRSAPRGAPDGARRPALRLHGNGRDGGRRREPPLAGRPRRSSSRPGTSASAGSSSARPTARTSCRCATSGGGAERGRRRFRARGRRRRARRLPHALRDLDRRRLRPRRDRAGRGRLGRARLSWTRSRASAPARSTMDASGLDVVVSGSQKALMTPPGLATTAVSATGRRRGAGVALAALSTSTGRAR